MRSAPPQRQPVAAGWWRSRGSRLLLSGGSRAAGSPGLHPSSTFESFCQCKLLQTIFCRPRTFCPLFLSASVHIQALAPRAGMGSTAPPLARLQALRSHLCERPATPAAAPGPAGPAGPAARAIRRLGASAAASAAKRVWFIRHGESETNVSEDWTHRDPDLTSRGRHQAESVPADPLIAPALAPRGSGTQAELVVTSPLTRTLRTATLALGKPLHKPRYLWEICLKKIYFKSFSDRLLVVTYRRTIWYLVRWDTQRRAWCLSSL